MITRERVACYADATPVLLIPIYLIINNLYYYSSSRSSSVAKNDTLCVRTSVNDPKDELLFRMILRKGAAIHFFCYSATPMSKGYTIRCLWE